MANDALKFLAGRIPLDACRRQWQRLSERVLALTRFQAPRADRRRTDDLGAADIQLLEAIAQAQTRRFRFPAGLEDEFQQYTRIAARTARVSVALLTVLMFGTAPLWTPLAFAVPERTRSLMTLIELAIAPLFGALTLAILRRPASQAVEWLMIAAFALEMFTIEALRYLSGQAGLDIDPSLAVATPVAVLVLARLPMNRCLLFIAVYFAGMAGMERYGSDAIVHRSPTAWMMEGILVGAALLSVLWTRLTMRRQWAANVLLEILAYRDPLTGLPNRRAFEEHYDTLSRALVREPQRTMLFALVDLDHFKALNDHYGHAYGDGALAEIGLALAGFARRPLDIAARLGGEEFALLLYDCEPGAAEARAYAIVDGVRKLCIEHEVGATGVVTCSVGTVVVHSGETLSDAYRRADECLYQAKRRGRNSYRVLT